MDTKRRFVMALLVALPMAWALGAFGDHDMRADSGQFAQFCAVMRDLDQKSLAAFTEDATEEQLDAAMLQLAKMYAGRAAEIEKTVPDALRADMRTILDTYRAFAGGKPDALEAAAYLDATDRLEDWLEKNCGMVLTEPDEQ